METGARATAYQVQRRNVAATSSASAGLRMAIDVAYDFGPVIDVDAHGSMPAIGRSRPRRSSIRCTTSGGSAAPKVVGTVTTWLPAGWLRLVNEAPASVALGTMRMPLPVSMCTARQLTSTTRPFSLPVSSQSPSLNGCSNSSSRPEMIDPTAFCRAKPRMIDVTPRAAMRPPTSAPQTHENRMAKPITTRSRRTMSTKIDGIRSRHVPVAACWNSTTLSAASTRTISKNPNTVARICTHVVSLSSSHTWVNSTHSAPAGTAKLRNIATGAAIGLPRRTSQPCNSVERDEHDRQDDDEPDGPREPRLRRQVVHDSMTSRQTCSVPVEVSTVPAASNVVESRRRSYTRWLTTIPG